VAAVECQLDEAVEVDFAGVTDVGQGFVDEPLRVWPNAHQGRTVTPINMDPAVELMVRRGLPRAEGRDRVSRANHKCNDDYFNRMATHSAIIGNSAEVLTAENPMPLS